ncbi:hypothetical protein LT85_2268 [Collimonas arenae]|uniref:DUF4124 domain-containing protein n=1 Tax=Collimonas arenae TaxID=279058 RepID=A0A0A1FA74_9BURK|nr:hypothetical protein [Collimonas arenae]AIY41426.1 hypothetical protein LT85_2268 [Collimonas arenae]
MHPTARIFAAFLLAIALASAVLYAIDRSITPANGKGPAPVTQAKADAASPVPAIHTADPVAPVKAPAPVAASSAPTPLPAGVQPTVAGNTIVKCSIDGKIVYTDKGCPQGSKAKSLQIIDNAVIPGYDRTTVENAFRQQPPVQAQARPTPSGGVIEPVTSISTEPSVDCVALGRRYDWLNGMSHRRQLPHVRDHMRRERDELQTRMFWAHC